MSSQNRVPVDTARIAGVSRKVMNLLQRGAKSPGEAYIVCKLLVLFFENNYGLKMDPQDEKMLMDLVKETADLKDEVIKQSNGNKHSRRNED